MSKYQKYFKDAFFTNNPVFFQLLGLCPTLAVTSSTINGVGMGISTMAVLICSSFFISLLKNYIPNSVRIPSYIVIIATFVTIVQLLLEAYIPFLHNSLGAFIPLIVVNCLILARAESFASKNTPIDSIVDGLSMGLGFTFALTILGAIRELLGNGSLLGINIFELINIPTTLLFILPPGAFIVLGFILAAINYLNHKYNKEVK